MGNVVKLDAGSRARGARPAPVARARRARRSKTALVLGGGGFTGGVYEIGALRAFDLLSVNKTINQFDVYVGTSAGAFIAALAANGVTPEEMMRVVNQQVPTPFRDIDVGTLLRPNLAEYVTKAVALPLRLAGLLRSLAGQLGQLSAMDILFGLAEGLPSGLYSGAGIEHYVRAVLSDPDRVDDFRVLEPEALPHGNRPRYLRADRVRRQRLGRRADLDGSARFDSPADGLQARQGKGSRAG